MTLRREQIWKYPWAGSSTSRANSQPFLAGEDLIFISKGYGQGATVFRVDGDQGVEIGRIRQLHERIYECSTGR